MISYSGLIFGATLYIRIRQKTHGSVGAFLSRVFSTPAVHLNVDVVDDVEKVLHDGHLLIPGTFIVRLACLLIVQQS